MLSTSLTAFLLLASPLPAPAQNSQQGNELLVAAAADLAPLEAPLAQAFARVAGGRVRFVLGSSGLLTRQIEQGAPYDVFLSANEEFVAELVRGGKLLPGSVRVYAYGRLGLWSPGGALRTLPDLLAPRVLHVALPNPTHAPYGAAARQLLRSEGLWSGLEPKVVYGQNVRQALQYAESSNAEAVITAWSLLLRLPGAVLLPDSAHPPIRHAAGVVRGSPHERAARRFLDFLTSEAGRRILADNGLTPSQ